MARLHMGGVSHRSHGKSRDRQGRHVYASAIQKKGNGMTDRQAMQFEAERVRHMLGDAIAQIEVEGGDVRMFSAALLIAGVEMHGEVFGTDALSFRIFLPEIAREQLG